MVLPAKNCFSADESYSRAMLSKWRFSTLLISLMAGLLLAATVQTETSAAALNWSFPAVNLSAKGERAYNPQLAVAANDTTAAVWTRWDSDIHPLSDSLSTIQTSTRLARSSTFGAAQSLSGPKNTYAYDYPQLAMAADSAATVIWVDVSGFQSIVQSRTRSAGSNIFSPVKNLFAEAQHFSNPQLAAAADGAVTVVWAGAGALGVGHTLWVVTRPAGSDTFNPAENLSATGQHAENPQIAIAADGATTIVWSGRNGANDIIQARTRPAGSSIFSAVENLSEAGQSAENPQIAIAADDTATVAWQRWDGFKTIIQARTRPAGSNTFAAAENLSASGQNAVSPQLAASADGATTIVWSRWEGSEDGQAIVQASTRSAGSGAFSEAVNLSGPGQSAGSQQVAVGSNGVTAIVWQRSNGSEEIIQASTRSAGAGVFSGAVNLSASGQNAVDPQVAITANGTATVIWSRGGYHDEDGSSGDAVIQTRTSGSGGSFIIRSVNANSKIIRSTVFLPGPGKLAQRATRKSRGRAMVVCKTISKISKAGAVKLTCKLSKTTRKALSRRSLKVRIKTTFTLPGGQSVSKTNRITLKRKLAKRPL